MVRGNLDRPHHRSSFFAIAVRRRSHRVNTRGIRTGAVVQNVFTFAKVAGSSA